jgi:hypothetical protein
MLSFAQLMGLAGRDGGKVTDEATKLAQAARMLGRISEDQSKWKDDLIRRAAELLSTIDKDREWYEERDQWLRDAGVGK